MTTARITRTPSLARHSIARIAVVTLTLFLPMAIDQGIPFTIVCLLGVVAGGAFARSLFLATKQILRARRRRIRRATR